MGKDFVRWPSLLAFVLVLAPCAVRAQSTPPQVTLPTVTVTAQKEPADPQRLPLSVSVIPEDWMSAGHLTWISDAGVFAPNVTFTEFTARKLSNARIRGIGSSPGNPSVTTYIDGVPQLNANISNVEFTGVGQIEFVRGPQSALFGRNALGGIINISSTRPSLSGWNGEVFAPIGNFGARDLRAAVSGPVSSSVAIGVSGGHAQRDGFTVNTITGNDVDHRSANFGKFQLLATPSNRWETRVIVSAEHAEDGDYALSDLEGVRANPFTVARDFEGHTDRSIFNATVLNRYEGGRISITSATGLVDWDTEDATDLDYTPLPLITRDNAERATQFTQEVRVASAAASPVSIGGSPMRWQAGISIFTQGYQQNAVNTFSPFVLSPLVPVSIQQTSPDAELDDVGVGLFGQATLSVMEDFDITIGMRFDHENKSATIATGFAPEIALVDTERSFSNVSPQAAFTYRFSPDRLVYLSAARGFKAGGFNPASPVGLEAYQDENSWNVEGGVKSLMAGGRLLLNASVFSTTWRDLQLDVPNPFVPAQFYVANVGGARSRGVELELRARPQTGIDVFSAFGYTHARFADGTTARGIEVSDNELPFTPSVTFTVGTDVTREIASNLSLYGRGEVDRVQ